MIDRASVKIPCVAVSEAALAQLDLMVRCDVTLEGKDLRILIAGKGCHGFDYQVGFDGRREDDVVAPLEGVGVDVIMDPFSAHYLAHCRLDYRQDFANDEEGFVVENEDQDSYRGKSGGRIPPLFRPFKTWIVDPSFFPWPL